MAFIGVFWILCLLTVIGFLCVTLICVKVHLDRKKFKEPKPGPNRDEKIISLPEGNRRKSIMEYLIEDIIEEFVMEIVDIPKLDPK